MLPTMFQSRRFYRNWPIRDNNCLWRPCLLMIGTKWMFISQSVSEKIFRNRPIGNKNCLWQPYLLLDRDEMSNLYRGPPIDASYQVSVHLAKRFQRRRFFRNQPIRNKNFLWRPCFSRIGPKYAFFIENLPYICFLTSFGSFGQANSKEKIFFKIDQLETRIAYGGHVC